MTLFTRMLKLDKDSPGGAGGTPPVVPKEQVPPAATPPPAEEEGDAEFDDLGYKKTAPAAAPEKKGEAPKAGEDPKEAPVTEAAPGYGKEPPVVEPVVEDPAAPPTPPAAPDDLDKALEGVPEFEAKEIKAFAVENKLDPAIAKKWGEKVKANVEKMKADAIVAAKKAENQIKEQRLTWYKELKEDKDFGGDKFDLNSNRAFKVLTEFMPSTKKVLTANGSMLPPYVMRDLAKLADHLYATDKLQTGEPIKPEVADEEDDGTAFYKS